MDDILSNSATIIFSFSNEYVCFFLNYQNWQFPRYERILEVFSSSLIRSKTNETIKLTAILSIG